MISDSLDTVFTCPAVPVTFLYIVHLVHRADKTVDTATDLPAALVRDEKDLRQNI
jgi:hypothetical protein